MRGLGALEQLYSELESRAREARAAGLIARVAFDCDQTLIDGDIGEAALATAILEGSLPSDERWWSPLSPQVMSARALDELRARYLLERRGEVSQELFALIWRAYEALCGVDIYAGYLLAARLYLGEPLASLHGRCEEVVSSALARPMTPCPLTGGLVSRGVRVRPLMRRLVARLSRAGLEVWVVSSSQRELVMAMAQHLGISAERVLGLDFLPEGARLGPQAVEPSPIAQGKSDRFLSEHGRPPIGMFGDSQHDLPLMRDSGWGALINHGDPSLAARAERLGAHVIPVDQLSSLA